MKGYSYDTHHFGYIGEMELYLDPVKTKRLKENHYLIPAYCTITPPPNLDAVSEGKWPVFDTHSNSWKIMDDQKDKTGYVVDADGFVQHSMVITEYARERFLLDTIIIIPIPNSILKPQWNGTAWIEYEEPKNISVLKDEKIQELKDKAYEAITEKYPLWKQVNIISDLQDYTANDKSGMAIFIRSIRTQSNACETEVRALLTKEAVKQYTYTYVTD